MDFKWICDILKNLYKYGLSRFVGIGKAELSYRDMLTAYVYKHQHYLQPINPQLDNEVLFIGILDTTPINGQNTRFYDNDEQAFGDGVAYLVDYYLSNTNTYGLPFGTKKKQVEYGS